MAHWVRSCGFPLQPARTTYWTLGVWYRKTMLEALLELVVEILGEALFALAGAVVQAAFAEATSDETPSRRALAAIGHVLMGGIAGAISLLVLKREVVAHVLIPGTSLILAPVSTGALLELWGKWWVRRGNVRMVLFTFWGGFSFALGMAVVRFVYFERPWTWF